MSYIGVAPYDPEGFTGLRKVALRDFSLTVNTADDDGFSVTRGP